MKLIPHFKFGTTKVLSFSLTFVWRCCAYPVESDRLTTETECNIPLIYSGLQVMRPSLSIPHWNYWNYCYLSTPGVMIEGGL